MQTHDFKQGDPAWHAHRATHFNASDAPAMLNCSPYMTRTELLRRLHTGLTPEVDQATQRRFDDGHRFEALARPLAEKILGEDLYPVTGSEGELSASFDGLTLMEDVPFEHKTLNDELRACFDSMETIAPEYRETSSGKSLPKQYRVQMEQQLIVCGGTRVLFMASKWNGDTLVEERHCWYYPAPSLRAEITSGWKQFAEDLATYQPAEVLPAVVAAVQPSLPAVVVRMDGALTVASNLPDFAVALRAYIDRIPAKPSTDQEFADAEAACKALKEAESALERAENQALSQMTDVEQMRRVVGDLRTLSKTTRLATEKLVAARKEAIRTEIYKEGVAAYSAHIEGLNKRIGRPYMPALPVDFAGAIKNKRTVDSLRDSVAKHLANAKIAANDVADRIQINIGMLGELTHDHPFLFPDTAQLVLKQADDLKALIKSRIFDHEKAEADRMERQRAAIAEQERAKAEAKARAELAEQTRREAAQRIQDEATAAASAQPATHIAQVLSVAPEADVSITVSNLPGPGAQLTRQFGEVLGGRSPVAAVQSTPTLRLGQIGERLGFNVTADFLKSLGFEPTSDKQALLFHEHQFTRICVALIRHIESVCELQAA